MLAPPQLLANTGLSPARSCRHNGQATWCTAKCRRWSKVSPIWGRSLEGYLEGDGSWRNLLTIRTALGVMASEYFSICSVPLTFKTAPIPGLNKHIIFDHICAYVPQVPNKNKTKVYKSQLHPRCVAPKCSTTQAAITFTNFNAERSASAVVGVACRTCRCVAIKIGFWGVSDSETYPRACLDCLLYMQ